MDRCGSCCEDHALRHPGLWNQSLSLTHHRREVSWRFALVVEHRADSGQILSVVAFVMSCSVTKPGAGAACVLTDWKERKSRPTGCLRVGVFRHEPGAGAARCVQDLKTFMMSCSFTHKVLELLDVLSKFRTFVMSTPSRTRCWCSLIC